MKKILLALGMLVWFVFVFYTATIVTCYTLPLDNGIKLELPEE